MICICHVIALECVSQFDARAVADGLGASRISVTYRHRSGSNRECAALHREFVVSGSSVGSTESQKHVRVSFSFEVQLTCELITCECRRSILALFNVRVLRHLHPFIFAVAFSSNSLIQSKSARLRSMGSRGGHAPCCRARPISTISTR